jgi:hypothetical protein
VPTNARVRILNIGPRFHQGIELEPGNYHVEASKRGYKTKKMWVNLDAGENKKVEVGLEQLQTAIKPQSYYSKPVDSNSHMEPKKTAEGTVIKEIRTVVTDQKKSQIIFELNGYYPPEIIVLEGSNPRIICDFFGARLFPGVKKRIPLKSGAAKGIRVGAHKGPKPKIRVIVDLRSGQNYKVEQFFFEKENYFALMIIDES